MSERPANQFDSTTILRVRGLETAFATEEGMASAVRGVSFDLKAGETLGVVGESGCGKTATALSIIQLLPPGGHVLAGKVELDGVGDLLSMSQKELQTIRGKRIAMVFQDSMTSLNPVLSIGRQVSESLETHLGMSRETARQRSLELLADVGVPEPKRRLRQFPHQLSGGLRQRVAIAIALSTDPDVLIADEPTTALDVTIQAQVLELLVREQANRNMAVILITHDLGVVAGIADRVSVMYAGRVVETGVADDLFESAKHPYTKALLESVPRMDSSFERRLLNIPGSPPPIWDIPRGCAFEPRCRISIPQCAGEDPPLERVSGRQEVACWVAAAEDRAQPPKIAR